jgi:hypothetical protein
MSPEDEPKTPPPPKTDKEIKRHDFGYNPPPEKVEPPTTPPPPPPTPNEPKNPDN